MKKILLTMIIIALSLQAQAEQIDTLETIPILKHEIGFSVGAFPLKQLDHPKDRFLFGVLMPEYTSYEKYEDGSYEKSIILVLIH